jgi:hypothetical protein
MRRRRKLGGKYRHKVQTKSLRVSGKRVSSQMCAVRFHWTGRKHITHEIDASKQELATYRLAIRCQARHTTPTQVMAELTLGVLISSWMRWLYSRQDRPSKGY